jgi:hypothetical protein
MIKGEMIGVIDTSSFKFKGLMLDELMVRVRAFENEEIDLIDVFSGDEAVAIEVLSDLIELQNKH